MTATVLLCCGCGAVVRPDAADGAPDGGNEASADAAPDAPPAPFEAGPPEAGRSDTGPDAEAGPPPCPTGATRCGDRCVDAAADPANCGGCGTVCPEGGNGARVCRSGRCGYDCRVDYGDCDGEVATGCETNLFDNPQHCGACGRRCADLPNVRRTSCLGLACRVMECLPGALDCDSNPLNGCEATGTRCP